MYPAKDDSTFRILEAKFSQSFMVAVGELSKMSLTP